MPSKDELCKKSGIKIASSESSAPLLVLLLRQLKQGGGAHNEMEQKHSPE
jgi:hypothetical protein